MFLCCVGKVDSLGRCNTHTRGAILTQVAKSGNEASNMPSILGVASGDASSSTAPKLAEEGGNGDNGHSLASTAAVVDALLDEMDSSDEDSTAGNGVDDGTAAQGGDHALAGHDAEALEGLLDELLSDDD